MDGDVTLVGREDALSAARDALSEAARGRGRIVLVRGEAGIGKTAFASALAKEAEARGADVVFGRAWELAEAPPYFPLWPCLRALGEALPAPGETDAFQLWERVLQALARAANDRLVCWVLEDLHAADLLTLDLLTFLAQPVRALRVIVIATARAQDPRITGRARERFVRLARGGLDLELSRLGDADVARVAEAVVGRALPAPAVRELAQLTSGNPLFVVECARAFRGLGAAPRAPLPQTVRQVVLERVALLPDDAREALGAAAILGREVSAGTLARVLDTLPARVIDALQPALDAGILVELRPGQFAFSHALVASAIEGEVAPARSADLHGRAASALAAAGDSTEVLVERARHALAAMRPELDAVALASRAAARLEALQSFDRALSMHERIEEARRAGFAPPASAEEQLHVAEICRAAGRHADARARALAVFDAARADGDGVRMAQAALVLGAAIRPATVDAGLVAALEEAERALGDAAPALWCRLHARLGAALQPAGDPAVPIAMVREALRRARAVGDDALVLDVLHVGSAALVDYAPIAARDAVFGELLQRAEAAGDDAKALRAQLLLALDFAELGSFSRCDDAIERALAASVRLGHPRWRWRPLLFASMRAIARGDVAASERALVEVQEFATLTDDPALAFSLTAHVGQVARLLHHDDAMRARLASLTSGPMPDVPHVALIRHVLSAAAFARLEDRESTQRAIAASRDAIPTHEGFFGALFAEACAFVEDRERCAAWRTALAAFEGRHVMGGHVPISYEGPFARVLALLDSVLGDHAAAETRLASALAEARTLGHRTIEAQVLYDMGVTRARAGRASDAQRAFAEAIAIADAVGMTGLVMRARSRRGAPRDERSPAPGPRITMRREGDVWSLEHDGRAVRVKDSRGMQLLARLVERPGEEMHVLALASDELGRSVADDGAGDALDARAKREYKERLDELAAELASAERDADAARAARLERERAILEAELAQAFGLGGKARRSGSASERARVNVQRRLKDALARITEADAALGAFLQKTVHTGTYCRFFA